MTQRTFNLACMVIFSAVCVLHGLRLALGWQAVIAGWNVPTWLSWVAFIASGFLAGTAVRLPKNHS